MSTQSDAAAGDFWGDVDDEVALERYRTLVDALDDGIYQLDPEGRFVAVNDAIVETTGYDRDELLGNHVSLLLEEADVERIEGEIERVLAEDADGIGTVELGVRTADDEWVPCELRITPLVEDGEFQGTYGVARGVAEHEDRRLSLSSQADHERELESELQTVLGRISDAFYAVDEEFRFTHVNERAEELLQHSASELVGERIWEVFPSAAEIDEVWDAFHAARDTQEATSYELYYEELDFWVEANLYPSESGISVYFRDVTERKERQQALEESEQRYRTLAEYFPNGLVTLFDHDLEYSLAAGQGFDRIPLEPADLEGRRFDEVWPEETAAEVRPAFEAALDGEETSIELEYAGREWVVHAVPITDERGSVFAGMTMAQDITEQKEHENYLAEAKEQLEAATEAGAVGTWEWHVQEDEFVAGASFARTFGVDPDAAREGVSLDRLLSSIHAADRDRVAELVDEAVENCGEYEAEYRVWNADDELRWVVARGHVECDEAGEAVTFPGALTDITERKRAELELEKQRRELETLFDVLPVGVVVADADGSLLRANDTAREIWGGDVFDADSVEEYDKYEAVWADSGEPVGPEDWTMVEVLGGEEVTEPNVYEIDAFDGQRRFIMEHGMPVRDGSGAVTRAVVTLTDISERKEFERKLKESNERLEQFAYAASHDLQEPLRMVTSYLQLIERRYADALDEDGEEFLEFAVDGAERMREMIDGLLQYSRVETRGDPFESVDLEAVLADVREDLQVRIEETDAEITASELPRVEGDASQLRQVFQNLLDNAIEYSGDEPPRVRVDAERCEARSASEPSGNAAETAGDRWLVSVADEGIGIDPGDADRVFDVFQRLHTNEEHPGTGIGLALCKRIVERHGGTIHVDSTPGEGATFTFTLPAADDATPE